MVMCRSLWCGALLALAGLLLCIGPCSGATSGGQPFYESCLNKSSLCFGMPDNCVANTNCKVLFRSDFDQKSGFHLQLLAPSITADQYIAFGFSNKSGMSGLVLQCFHSSGSDRTEMQYSFNGYGKPHNAAIQNATDVTGFTNLKASFQNGQLLCEWSASPTAKIFYNGISPNIGFDFVKDKFYLSLALGPFKPADSRIHYHGDTNRVSSSSPTLLSIPAVPHTNGNTQLAIKWHAALMIFGWIGCVTIAIVMARFTRDLWPEGQLFGQKYWFVVHRYLMIIGWLAMVASYIVIFVQFGGWSKTAPHAVIGMVAGILATLQIGNSFLRPAPNTKHRWLFDYGHWVMGNVAHILAIYNIIQSGLKRSIAFSSLLFAYLFVYLLFSDALRKLESLIRKSLSSTRVARIFHAAVLGAVGVIAAITVALIIMMFNQ